MSKTLTIESPAARLALQGPDIQVGIPRPKDHRTVLTCTDAQDMPVAQYDLVLSEDAETATFTLATAAWSGGGASTFRPEFEGVAVASFADLRFFEIAISSAITAAQAATADILISVDVRLASGSQAVFSNLALDTSNPANPTIFKFAGRYSGSVTGIEISATMAANYPVNISVRLAAAHA